MDLAKTKNMIHDMCFKYIFVSVLGPSGQARQKLGIKLYFLAFSTKTKT